MAESQPPLTPDSRQETETQMHRNTHKFKNTEIQKHRNTENTETHTKHRNTKIQ